MARNHVQVFDVLEVSPADSDLAEIWHRSGIDQGEVMDRSGIG
jgi:hypothetical protein